MTPEYTKQVHKILTWLKSLPERFNLQLKQEWSEADKNILEKAVDQLVEEYVEGIKKLTDTPTWDLMRIAVCHGYELGLKAKQSVNDVEYIRKDAILEWLQNEWNVNAWFYETHAKPNEVHSTRCEVYKRVIDKVKSL